MGQTAISPAHALSYQIAPGMFLFFLPHRVHSVQSPHSCNHSASPGNNNEYPVYPVHANKEV